MSEIVCLLRWHKTMTNILVLDSLYDSGILFCRTQALLMSVGVDRAFVAPQSTN